MSVGFHTQEYWSGLPFSSPGDLESKAPSQACNGRRDAAAAKSLQSYTTLCDPIDGSPPGSPVPGVLQARILEWVAFPPPVHESEKTK